MRLIKSMMELPDEVKDTPEGKRQLKVVGMMLKEPNIAPAVLGKVTAPTLVLASDNDLIRLEHIVDDLQEPAERGAGDLPEQRRT